MTIVLDKVQKAQAVTSPLDEVELSLQLLKQDYPHLVQDKTYKQIAGSLNRIFGLNTNEADVFLLHEPTIEELEEDLRVQFSALGLVY